MYCIYVIFLSQRLNWNFIKGIRYIIIFIILFFIICFDWLIIKVVNIIIFRWFNWYFIKFIGIYISSWLYWPFIIRIEFRLINLIFSWSNRPIFSFIVKVLLLCSYWSIIIIQSIIFHWFNWSIIILILIIIIIFSFYRFILFM